MPFEIGAVVVLPQHGLCRIEARRKSYFASRCVEFYVLEHLADSSIFEFATSELEGRNIRDPFSMDDLRDVVDVLRTPPPRLTSNWSRRFKSHTIVLSPAERVMFDRCYNNLLHETAHVTQTSIEDAAARLDTALQECLRGSAP